MGYKIETQCPLCGKWLWGASMEKHLGAHYTPTTRLFKDFWYGKYFKRIKGQVYCIECNQEMVVSVAKGSSVKDEFVSHLKEHGISEK